MNIEYALLALSILGIIVSLITWLWSSWRTHRPTASMNETVDWSNDHNFSSPGSTSK